LKKRNLLWHAASVDIGRDDFIAYFGGKILEQSAS